MIYATVNMTVGDYSSTCDQNIVLYRGDKNVEIRFVIKGNRFTVLDSTYAQMIIRRPSSVSIFSEPAAIQNDTVVLTITEDMIDELKEIGEYTFQIRLYDNSMNARATLPPCNNCLIINQPIAVEGEALVNVAMVNDSAVLAAVSDIPEEEIFTEDNAYNRTVWVDGDIITDARMNKIENALYYINEKGGGGTATAPYISTSIPETVMVGSGEDFILDLDFSSPNLGKGTLKVFVNDVDVMSPKIDQGISNTTIPSKFFAKGTNMVVVYVLDRVGMMSNSLTFYIRYGGTEVSSTFDPYVSYDYGATVRYYFTPTALDTSLQLTFFMEIDGVTQSGVPCVSDVRSYYTFPTNLAVGNHECRAWVTDGSTNSNVLKFNLIILDATSLVVASDTSNPTVEEGTQLVLDYKVYMKNNTSFITKTYVDGNLVNTGTCTLETAYYRTTTLTEGQHTVKVEVWDVTETKSDFIVWTVTVTPSTYTMLQPAKAGSLFIATAYSKSNVDENRELWRGSSQDDEDIDATLSNFSFNNENGWIDDALVISGNSWVEIPVKPLANNAQYGFTLDIEFSTKPIGVEDAEVLSIWNEADNCGIKITTEQLIMRSKSGNQCDLYFGEDENVSAIFVIDRDEKTAKIYLNGVMCEAFALSDYEASGQKFLEDFTVNSNVYLGGYNNNGYCAIKNIRIYEVALATNEILNNFMSNEKDKAAQRALVEFQKGNTLPTLTIYCDFAGLGKDDKKPCNIVYNSPDVNLYGESFTLDGKHSMLQYQGTSSMQYPIKNYRINPRNADGKVKLDPFNNGVGESRFTLKADFMSSGHWQNTGLAKWVNDKLYNYNINDPSTMNARKWYDLQNGGSLKGTRESINGFPCRLILVNDGETALNEGQQEPTPGNTKDMGIFNFNNDKDNVKTLGFDTDIFPNCMSFEVTANSDTSAGAFVPYDGDDEAGELKYLQNSFELRYPDEDDVGKDYGYLSINGDTSMGLKRVIDWVGNATDEQFVAEFDQYFHRDYTLRYYILVIVLGMVDNLGKNMMFDTFDGKIWLPRFYDMDTICSYDNSGEIKFDVDIEMEQGYWNTSSSRLWTKIRDLMHDELVEKYKDMRQNGMSFESFMSYFYDKQIAQIPQTYYNKDYDVKYAPYADEYMGKAHGDGYEHLKRWLKRRFIFTDTLFDYAPSYTNDALTIRANTLDLMRLEIETYTPVYQHVSFYNGNMEKIKIDGKTSTIFEGTAQTATDQEVLIYGGSNIKAIRGIQSMNPNSMLIGNATRLTELDLSDCPILTVVNSNKANFSPHTYLNKLDISNCPQLGGTLNISNSPLLQEVNALGSAVDNILFPTSVRNLETLRVPKTVTSLTLTDAGLLYTIEMEEGNNLQSISLTNCNNLTETINFDLTQVPTVLLDNSYNGEEIYMSATTNLTLKNMPTLKRVIFTPNSEYSAFDINNVINGASYKITTFNNPLMTDFITTAPHRLSYPPVEMIEVTKNILSNVTGTFTNSSYINCDTGAIGTPSDAACSLDTYIPITPGKEYTFTTNSTHNVVQIVFYKADKSYQKVTDVSHFSDVSLPLTFTAGNEYHYLRFHVTTGSGKGLTLSNYSLTTTVMEPEIPITPNIAFTANTLDLADTQFQNVKFLCTTDVYNLKVPTTLNNFYCDSAMDIDTDVIEDASYEVIHEELIEPYTTNYEGEVVRYEDVAEDIVWTNGKSQKIYVNGTSTYTLKDSATNTWVYVDGYDKSDTLVWSKHATSTADKSPFTGTTSEEVSYIVISAGGNGAMTVTYTKAYTPNIIPSSANGSLIFNMYSNNTTQPTSTSPYIWDLTGLKLNDFYTYGMNNWVKASEDAYVYYLDTVRINKWYYDGYGGGPGNYNGCLPALTFPEDVTTVTITSDDNVYCCNQIGSGSATGQSQWATSLTVTLNPTYRTLMISSTTSSNPTWIKLSCDNGMVYMVDFDGIEKVDIVDRTEWAELSRNVEDIAAKTLHEIKSITMPQRMPGYSVRLVNADITPDEYPTMLYPKLIDTTLPITGKLDYTAYNGSSLAWAYAYTTGDVTINPLDSRSIGQITHDYNKLYGTDFVDIVDVWAYADTDVSGFSTNDKITKAYIELTSANYESRIDEVLQWYPNCHDIYLFEDGSVTDLQYMYSAGGHNNGNGTRNQVQNIIFMEGYFNNLIGLRNAFTNCQKLVTVSNIPNGVADMRGAFEGCLSLTTAPTIPSGVDSLYCTFYNCTSLTTVPNIPNGVTNMSNAFYNCPALTAVPTIPDGVTNMDTTFYGCSALTTVPNIPNSLTNMNKTFQICTSLTTVPAIPNGVTSMRNTFEGCTALTTVPNIPENVTDMYCTFNSCTALTTAPTIPDTVTGMRNTFYGCAALTTAPNIPNGVSDLHSCFRGCSSLVHGAILHENIQQHAYMYTDCTSLKTAQVALTRFTEGYPIFTGCSSLLEEITWVGTRKSDFNFKRLFDAIDRDSSLVKQKFVQDLVPEHLGTVTGATLTLGETYLAYLTEEEIEAAVNKGWTLE